MLFAREGTPSTYGTPPLPATPEETDDWSLVHESIVTLGKKRASRERMLCRWLLAAERLGVPARAGHASLREYAERYVGLNGRKTEERLRVGRALARLPVLDAALGPGAPCFSAVREMTRVATPETEEEWCAWAMKKKSRQVEKAVAERRLGDGPSDRPDPALVQHRLSFKVKAQTMFRGVTLAGW